MFLISCALFLGYHVWLFDVGPLTPSFYIKCLEIMTLLC